MKRRGEAGATLQEVLIAMTITGMILTVLVATIFSSLHVVGSTESHIDQSSGATLFASYFGPDVQNALTVKKNVMETAACSSPRTVDLLLATGANSSVSYYRGTGANASVLYRRTCNGGVSSTSARLIRFLASAPAFQCAPDCGDATWRSVSADVTQIDPLDPTSTGKQYHTTLEGTRRAT
jgi:type II secretory pathway component PulJ